MSDVIVKYGGGKGDGGKEGSPLEWQELPQKFHARAALDISHRLELLDLHSMILQIFLNDSPAEKKDHLSSFHHSASSVVLFLRQDGLKRQGVMPDTVGIRFGYNGRRRSHLPVYDCDDTCRSVTGQDSGTQLCQA